jgi:Flp pilus assembly protein TadD
MTSARATASISAGLVLLCLVAYARLWRNDFIDLDDEKYITANVHVRDGLSRDNIVWAWTTYHAGLWIPLVWTSFQIDGTLSHYFGVSTGLMPSVYHGQNLFWHMTTAVLLFLTLKRMTMRLWPSALVAALFAVHPLHVESVAWATERKDVLSGFFWMLTLFAYARYTEKPTLRHYALVILAFLLGLLAKPMLVTLPCALLLLDYWPLRRYGWKDDDVESAKVRPGLWRIVLEKIPLFLLAVAGILVTIQAEHQDGSVVTLADLSIPSRLANAATSYAWYLEKTFWPSHLCVFYTHPMNDWSWPPVLVSAALLVAISACALITIRRAPWFLVGWLWFLGTLAPVIGLVQVGLQARGDRFVYIPHVGLFIAIVWGTEALLERRKVGLHTWVMLGTGCVLALTVATIIQVGYWKNSLTVWTHALAVTHENHRAHSLLGWSFLEKYTATGDKEYLDRAYDHLREAVRIKPGNPDYENNFGVALFHRGQLEEAGTHFRETLRTWPNHFKALQNLGLIEYLRKNYSEAVRLLRLALELSPQDAETHAHLGQVFWDMGQHDEARKEWESALALNGNLPEALEGMGQAFLLQGSNEDAVKSFQASAQLQPGQPRTWSQLGIAAGRLKQWDQAIAAHERGVKLAVAMMRPGPDLSAYIRRLAFALHSADRNAEAQFLYTECTKLDSSWASTNLETAWKLATSAELKPGDAATAFELASETGQATATPSARVLDVQAATLAATGRFDEAVVVCRKALMQATADQTGAIAARLALYEQKRRYVAK